MGASSLYFIHPRNSPSSSNIISKPQSQHHHQSPKIPPIFTLPPRIQPKVAVLVMPTTSLDDSSSEAEILPFPTLTLLQGYVDNVRKSANNPTLQSTEINFLMMNIVAVVDALKGADASIATLTRELESLKKSYARLEIRCDQTHDNNGWLSERYKETQKTNVELAAANKKLEATLSFSSIKEGQLSRRVASLEVVIHKLSALITKHRLHPYKIIQSWVAVSLPPVDNISEGWVNDNFVEPCPQDQGAVVEVGGKPAIHSISPSPTVVTHKLWDDAFTTTDSESQDSVAKSDDHASELSLLTDAVKYNVVQNKVSREMRTATQGNLVTRANLRRIQPVISPTRASVAINNRLIKEGATARLAKLDTQPTEPDNNAKPAEEHVVSAAELVARVPRTRSQPKIYPPYNHLAQNPIGNSIQNAHEHQIGNTCQDRTRYADIARDPAGGGPAYADSINPQVVVADPDEVAGDWNDVPVPMELRRKTPEKPLPNPLTHERSVFMVGLPPTITVSMLASFVRGGKVESIIIVDEGKKGGVQSAVITFFSRKVARRLMNWMLESPRLVMDRHIARPSLLMALPPPTVPSGGGSRVVIVKNIPEDIQTNEEFWNFVHHVATKYTLKIGVQETHVWSAEDAGDEKRVEGAVVFDTYQMGIEMSKIFKQRLRLDVKWGHDRCEDPLVTQKFYEFVEYKKKKQYDDESD